MLDTKGLKLKTDIVEIIAGYIDESEEELLLDLIQKLKDIYNV